MDFRLAPAELEARLRLHALPHIGPRRFHKLLDAFGDARSALDAPAETWHALGLPHSSTALRRHHDIRAALEAALAWQEQPGQHILCHGQPGYPSVLNQLVDAPPLLFVLGQPALLEQPQVAIVGSRRASQPGQDLARQFSASLARCGLAITSGLALGIDAAAHQGALDVQGQTLAVLGTGLSRLYPRRHQHLARQIVEQGGVLVSELPLDEPPHAANFPRRNRIISGLALGVLVVEASPSSGSLITARLAADQGREVWAIPGSIHNPTSRGCHALLKEGAQLVETVQDILHSLEHWHPQAIALAQSTARLPALLDILRAAPCTSERLAELSGMPLPQVLVQLSELELEGQVARQQALWLYRPAVTAATARLC